MPGLRSLVARRRSSLTSPPYTVQRNTPSPSPSDTSDHAATPHSSEGGESPMTERGGSVGEAQETQSQDASDVQPVGSRTEDTPLINGEDAEERYGCTNINVGDTKQEESLLKTSEVDDSGEKPQSSKSARNINEEREFLPASEVSVACASNSSANVHSELESCKAIQSPISEQNIEQISAHVNKHEEENFMDAEPSSSEGNTSHQTVEQVESREHSVNKEEKPLETETPEGQIPDTEDERLLPSVEETRETVEKKCSVDIEKTDEKLVSDAEVRQEAACKVESWDTGGGGGGGDEGGAQADVSMTSVEEGGQESDESQLHNNVSKDLGTITEETEFPHVAETGANEKEETASPSEEKHCSVTEPFNKPDKGPIDDMEACMDVSGGIQVPEARNAEELPSSFESTAPTEGSTTSDLGRSDDCIDGEGIMDTVSGEAHDGGSGGEQSKHGEGNISNTDGDGNNLETPGSSGPPGDVQSQEGECSSYTENNSRNENEKETKMEKYCEETSNAEVMEDTKDFEEMCTSYYDMSNEDDKKSSETAWDDITAKGMAWDDTTAKETAWDDITAKGMAWDDTAAKETAWDDIAAKEIPCGDITAKETAWNYMTAKETAWDDITAKETETTLEAEAENDKSTEQKEVGKEAEAGVIHKGESPPSSSKSDADSGTQADSSGDKNLLSKLNQKNIKGGKKCSDLSAMEIESTLASRGVTIVRRVIDNKEQCSRGSDSSNIMKKESGTSIRPINKAIQSPFRGTSGSGISVSLQPSSLGQTNSPASKDFYKSINARGTPIQASSKINPALLNRRGSFQLTKGVSIHYNPKSGAANTNVRGNTVYSNPRGAGTMGSRGPRMYATPRGRGAQSLRGYPTNMTPRGGALPQPRRGTPQTNIRGLATPLSTRGMTRPQRYTSPRATVPRAAVPQPRATALSTTNVRGVAPQRFRGALSQQHQPRLPGLPPQGKATGGVLSSKGGETMQSRSTTMPPQAKYLKTSPDARSGDPMLQSKINTDNANLPLQSKAYPQPSSQPRPPDTLQSPQPGSAEVSPQSRSSQFSPQSLISGIQPHSEYGGPAAQSRTVGQSPQPVLAMSSASGVTTQTGATIYTSQSASAGHPTLPSSSHHLPQMNMMDHPSQTSAMGLPPHSVAGGSRLPPHSSGSFMAQPTSMASSSQVMPSHMTTSDRFSSNVASTGFPPIPNSEYLGRSGSDMFPTYNNPGEYTPHSSTSGFPHMSSGDFALQSTPGGFHAQTNLVGFPPHNDPCAYPQHHSSSQFSHNQTGIVRPPGSDAFTSHPSCPSFPVQGNPGTYPPIPCSEPYSTPSNPGADLFSYPGQRDFMMHPGSQYSSSNQMANQLQPIPPTAGHRDLPMSQSPRDLPIQSCNQGLSMPTAGGASSSMNNIIGDQYPGYGEPLAHSTYQDIPVSARTEPNSAPLAPNFREPDSRQNYRDSATPQYNSYREPGTQEGLRASQMHSGYRDLPLDPNMDLQPHMTPREQSAHSSFKDQQSARYQEDGMISRYLDQSVLNYPESGSLNSCREQPVPNFGSPATHASPGEQVMSACRENMNQINFPDTMSDNSSRQQLLPSLGEQINYGSYRGPLEFNNACEQPNPNLQESLNYAPNMNQVPKSAADNMYKDPNVPVSSYSVNSHHLSLEGVPSDLKFKDKDMTYPESSMLPSFTESFDHSSDDVSAKKGDGTNLPHFRGSDSSYQRNLPEYTNSPFHSQGAEASTSAAKDYAYSYPSDSKNSVPRESPAYRNQRGYTTPSSNSYSPAQSCSPDDVQYIGGSGDNFQAKSDFHIPGDSLVPPDKRILEYPISRGSSSTNNTQRNPSGRCISDSSLPNPETDASSSVNHAGKHYEPNFPVAESHKNAKASESYNFLGCGKGGETTRSLGGSNLTKSPESHHVGSPEKFPVGMSPNKSDSGSPSTQDRIVIKMKLLHSGSSAEENINSAENGNVTELRLANKSSVKYSLAKYTRWTIDSIINGREDVGNEEVLDKDSDCEAEEEGVKEEKKGCITDSPKKPRKRRNSDVCEDSKDTNLDTNKNFMKKSLKITITNPLRNRMSSDDGNEDRCVERKSGVALDSEKNFKDDADKVQSLSGACEGRSSPGQGPESQFHYSARKGKVGSEKIPSPTPSGEICSSSTGGVQPECEGRRSRRGSEASPGGFCGEVNDHVVTSDVKKCSIVIKRIYKNDNFSCYSSSLCDKKTVLSIDDGIQRRSKRRAAVEASERCHKTLRSLDTLDAKSRKISLAGVLSKNKDILSVNLATNKTIANQIPECSVMLYDVFMNRRINQMVCPGCSRHYDSSDSVQVNMNKATISLLCSSCQWLVVKDVHPHEVDSLVPS